MDCKFYAVIFLFLICGLLSASIRTTSPPTEDILKYNIEESEDSDEEFDRISNPETVRDRAKEAFAMLEAADGPVLSVPSQSGEHRRTQRVNTHSHHTEQQSNENVIDHDDLLTLTVGDSVERNDSCAGDLFKHKVRMAGCEPKIIINRFCHGSCSSFYIPKLRSRKLKATFQSCAACVPVETDQIKVRLNCPQRPEKQIIRTVVRVRRCACRNIQFDEVDEIDS